MNFVDAPPEAEGNGLLFGLDLRDASPQVDGVTMKESLFTEFEARMRGAAVGEASRRSFRHHYEQLVAGRSGLIAEDSIEPVTALPRLDDLSHGGSAVRDLLARTVVIKLNGGLGTSMGLEKAKSLLVVKDGMNFLDIMASQILFLRSTHGVPVRFTLMNSFSTSRDTLAHMARHPGLAAEEGLELMQGRVPKVEARTLAPARWAANPDLEWCPPGHGDLYPSLRDSGMLRRLLDEGRRYLFVSNADNLGATLDLDLLGYFAESGLSFLMEVAERTASDRKGGHLARRRADGRLLLRELAQCPEPDLDVFQDVARHGFFNTNSLWIRLDDLEAGLDRHGGFLPLPMIKNRKPINPRDRSSVPVFQLETAMGAAIECFEKSGAVVVPRGRFAPVKTTSDLLCLRSDACVMGKDFRVSLAAECGGEPPRVELDARHAGFVEQLDAMTPHGAPSLRHCRRLVVRGPVIFERGVVCRGEVEIVNASSEARRVRAGVYADATFNLE